MCNIVRPASNSLFVYIAYVVAAASLIALDLN